MKRSTKALISTVAVIGISAASISYVSAYGGPGGFGGCNGGGYGAGQPWQQGHGPMMQQRGFNRGFGGGMEQFMQQRLDQAKYTLRITKEQEPAWKEFTEAVGKKAATMQDRRQQRGTQQPVTERVKRMRDGAEQMTQMADAVEKMYKTLTPEQQKIADQFTPGRMRPF